MPQCTYVELRRLHARSPLGICCQTFPACTLLICLLRLQQQACRKTAKAHVPRKRLRTKRHTRNSCGMRLGLWSLDAKGPRKEDTFIWWSLDAIALGSAARYAINALAFKSESMLARAAHVFNLPINLCNAVLGLIVEQMRDFLSSCLELLQCVVIWLLLDSGFWLRTLRASITGCIPTSATASVLDIACGEREKLKSISSTLRTHATGMVSILQFSMPHEWVRKVGWLIVGFHDLAR